MLIRTGGNHAREASSCHWTMARTMAWYRQTCVCRGYGAQISFRIDSFVFVNSKHSKTAPSEGFGTGASVDCQTAKGAVVFGSCVWFLVGRHPESAPNIIKIKADSLLDFRGRDDAGPSTFMCFAVVYSSFSGEWHDLTRIDFPSNHIGSSAWNKVLLVLKSRVAILIQFSLNSSEFQHGSLGVNVSLKCRRVFRPLYRCEDTSSLQSMLSWRSHHPNLQTVRNDLELETPIKSKRVEVPEFFVLRVFRCPPPRIRGNISRHLNFLFLLLSHFNLSFSSGLMLLEGFWGVFEDHPPDMSPHKEKMTNHFRTTTMGIRLKADALIGIGRLKLMVPSKNWPEIIGCLPTAERWQNNVSYGCFFKQGGTEGVLTSCNRESVGTSKSFLNMIPVLPCGTTGCTWKKCSSIPLPNNISIRVTSVMGF